MAIRLADALVFLGARTDNLRRDLEGAEGETRNWASRLGGTITTLIGGAVIAGAAAAAAAIVGIGAAAITTAGDIDRATDMARTRLGLTVEDAEEFADVIRTVYGENFGESIEDVGAAVETTFRALGDAADTMANEDLARITEQALAVRDAFGIDVAESVRTVSILMRNGVAANAEEAFGIVVAGMQQGLNVSDDLLDTLNEYADDFAGLGLTAPEVLGMLNRGLEAGAYNTDKIGDALNEFGVNLRDPAISEGLHTLDAGVAGIYDQFQAGQITERQALDGMLTGLAAIEDPIARDTAGVLLFRSMWEDLGEGAILALGGIETGTIGIQGATDSLNAQYDNIGSRFEGLWRRVQLALEPVGAAILDLAEQFMPQLEEAAAWLAANLPAIMDQVVQGVRTLAAWLGENIPRAIETASAFWQNNLRPALEMVGTFIVTSVIPAFQSVAAWLSVNVPAAVGTVSGFWNNTLRPALENVWNFIQTNVIPIFQRVADWLGVNLPPIIQAISDLWNNTLRPALENVWAFIQDNILPIVGTLIDTFRNVFEGAIQLLAAAWNNVLLPALEAVWNFIQNNILPIFNEVGRIVDTVIRPIFEEVLRVINEVLGAVGNAIRGVQDFVTNALNSIGGVGQAMNSAIPAVLKPGSPTPFEMGLRGIQGAMRDLAATAMPDLSMNASLNPAFAGAGAGGSGTTIGSVNVHVALERLPQTTQEADEGATRLVDAMRRKGM